jgi:hypothetical protein
MEHEGRSGMSSAEKPVSEVAHRVRAEYLEMPGLVLTKGQMCRFCVLDPPLCDAVLDELVATGFLRCREDKKYARAVNDA